MKTKIVLSAPSKKTKKTFYMYFLFFLILHTQKEIESTKEKKNTACASHDMSGDTPEPPLGYDLGALLRNIGMYI